MKRFQVLISLDSDGYGPGIGRVPLSRPPEKIYSNQMHSYFLLETNLIEEDDWQKEAAVTTDDCSKKKKKKSNDVSGRTEW